MRRESGLGLIDATIATALLATALVGLAQLLVGAAASNASARRASLAVVIASAKIEELRSIAGVATAGADYVDAWGTVLGDTPDLRSRAAFVRRWSVSPLAGSTLSTHLIRVSVESTARLDDSVHLDATVRR